MKVEMFGATIRPRPPVLKPRPVPKTIDVFGDRANTYGRIARQPNQCFDIKWLEYTQKKKLDGDNYILEIEKQRDEEKIHTKYAKHAEHKTFQRILKEKVDKKLIEYEVKIDERRKKLFDILWKEEREYVVEVVDVALKAKLQKVQERIQKTRDIKEQNEVQRLAVVKEKRLQQYLARCAEFRPRVTNQRLRETKEAQLIQIKENEAKRKSEEELNHFWHQMKLKYCEAVDEREMQDRLHRIKQNNEFLYYSDLQAKKKKGEQEMMRQEMLDECKRLDNLRKEMEEEERAYKEMKDKKRVEFLKAFNKQLKDRQVMLQRIAAQELEIQRAYDKLADEEIEKEQAAIRAKVSTGYNDMVQYKKYLAELKLQKEEEERNMGIIVEEALKQIQQADDAKKCAALMAKQALQEDVMKGREQQLEEQRKRKDELKKALELENQLTDASREQNNKLKLEYDRRNMCKAKQYRDDLKQQMAYKDVRDQRERDNLQKILDAAVIENQMYDSIVAEVLGGSIKISETHPFTQTIKDEKCPCPKPIY